MKFRPMISKNISFQAQQTSLTLLCKGVAVVALGLCTSVFAGRELTDAELRTSAPPRLLDSDVPSMDHLLERYVADKDVAIALGKALFWDTQVGGEGKVACASCHFQAGADPRHINQLSPGLLAGDESFNAKASGAGGINYELKREDFPFYEHSPDGKFDNDIVSSQGVFLLEFNGQTLPDNPGGDCDSVYDHVFNKDNLNTRRVEPRNTPTVINAVFNHRNFWDGRANNFFNGVNPFGLRGQLIDVNGPLPNINDPSDSTNRDPKKAIWEFVCDFEYMGFCFGGHLEPRWPLEENSSLASQAVGPPESIFEMSCGSNRGFNDIGRHLLQRRPLALQKVHANDSVLASYRHGSGIGLTQTYDQLVRQAFKAKWWSGIGMIPDDGDASTHFTQIEENFSLFWGIAIQLYEATLVANQTPFDAFARHPDGFGGADNAMTEEQKEGLEVFISADAKCTACHGGAEFTGASVSARKIKLDAAGNPLVDLSTGIPTQGEPIERMIMGNGQPAVYDGGFYNIGVRATDEDLCVGGEVLGVPLSFSRQASMGLTIDPESRVSATGEGLPSGPVAIGERVAVDGACKSPTVRMAAFTAPYFHSGQSATLLGVVEHYKEQFEELFSQENIDDLDADILSIQIGDQSLDGANIGGGDVDALTIFMAEALTDSRVVNESGPFDHPELCVSNGHPEPLYADVPLRPMHAKDQFLCVPAVGRNGRSADNLPPIVPFLGIDQANLSE